MKAAAVTLLLLLAPLSFARTVRPSDLLSGLSIEKQKRLQVRDVVAGTQSVRDLFRPIREETPSTYEYYVTTATHSVTLAIVGPEQLEKLLDILALQHTSTLQVILRDDRDTFLRGKWPFDHGYFHKTLEWTIEQTPCDQMTRIIYRKVVEAVEERLREGSTNRRVALNDVFNVLVHGDIDRFMASLGPAASRHPCFDQYELYRWLKGEDVSGFGFGQYELGEGMRAALRPAADALAEMRRDWKRYKLRIRVAGYADASKVETRKELRADAMGVKHAGPIDVRYDGCHGDTLDGKLPHYIKLGSRGGVPIAREIVDNCQLGAVRAYVALAYFAQSLGYEAVEYEYATGGVHPLATKRDATHRKLEIEFQVDAASDTR